MCECTFCDRCEKLDPEQSQCDDHWDTEFCTCGGENCSKCGGRAVDHGYCHDCDVAYEDHIEHQRNLDVLAALQGVRHLCGWALVDALRTVQRLETYWRDDVSLHELIEELESEVKCIFCDRIH
jgi:hypothetical protein